MGQNTYFDIRVTNTNSAYQIDRDLKKIYEKHERERNKLIKIIELWV